MCGVKLNERKKSEELLGLEPIFRNFLIRLRFNFDSTANQLLIKGH